MGNRAGSADRQFGSSAVRQTVEVRVRLTPDDARRLGVVAAVRGETPSEVVARALAPLLAFRMPDVPEPADGPRRRGRAAGEPGAAPPDPAEGQGGGGVRPRGGRPGS